MTTQNLIHLDSELDARFHKLNINKKVLNDDLHQVSKVEEILPHEKNHYCIEAHLDPMQNKENKFEELQSACHSLELQNKKSDEVISSDDEHSLNDFITQNVQIKIKFLKNKCENLEKTLIATQKKMKSMNIKVIEANKSAKESSKQVVVLNRSMMSKEQLLKKRVKEHEDLKKEISCKNDQYQKLCKDFHQMEIKLKEKEKNLQTLTNQNKNMKMKWSELQRDSASETARNKDREKLLQVKLVESEKKRTELQKHLFSLSMLVKKQDELLSILQQQKESIATARVTKKLEEELLVMIRSFSAEEDSRRKN